MRFVSVLICVAGVAPSFCLSPGVVAEELSAKEREAICAKCRRIMATEAARARLPESTTEARCFDELGWPVQLSEKQLLSLLESDQPRLRLRAAELLISRTRGRHRARILRAVEDVKAVEPPISARIEAVRALLGDRSARRALVKWAILETQPVGMKWSCLMHPQTRREHPGNCPICHMELVATPSSWQRRDAQRYALMALAELGETEAVSAAAEKVIKGGADDFWRLSAAYYWSRVAPEKAIKELRGFMRSKDPNIRWQATMLLAHSQPQKCIADFEQVVKAEKTHTRAVESGRRRSISRRVRVAAARKAFGSTTAGRARFG